MTPTNLPKRNENVAGNVGGAKKKTIAGSAHPVEMTKVTRSVNYADVID
jgi:hypothetical protein